ncbi:unnamed protein product [Microthlaspi erraticum]|uniref:Uncharacterized protein n=1 Tax=Microthlaspi erraticum TaxID=1685480 RepID=A0A6D2HEI5_9BRAS|nr:unnamed protein product [Microthlaspi erraticum]
MCASFSPSILNRKKKKEEDDEEDGKEKKEAEKMLKRERGLKYLRFWPRTTWRLSHMICMEKSRDWRMK